jgi:UDP-N-acetyl-D-mannosaminuronate dehydrogenase
MKITVVALGKIGLPLAVQFALMGHHVTGADVNPKTVDLVASGVEPFPGETGLERLAEVVADESAHRHHRHAAAVVVSEAVVVVVPLFVDADGVPDFDWMDAATHDVARGLQPWHLGLVRDDTAGRHHALQIRPNARGGLRTRGRSRLPLGVLA